MTALIGGVNAEDRSVTTADAVAIEAEQAAVIALLATNGAICSWVRETSCGDSEKLDAWLERMCPDAPRLLATLARLANEGVIERIETVQPYDSSEYRVTWRLSSVQE